MSAEMDHIRKQRLNLQSVMNAGRRELDQVTDELARLTQKKATLEETQARRQEQLDLLIRQMETMESTAAAAAAVAPQSPAPVQSSPSSYREPQREPRREFTTATASSPSPQQGQAQGQAQQQPHITPAVARQVFFDGDEDAEAQRLMRTLSRAKGSPMGPRVATVDPDAEERRKAKAAEDRRRREEYDAKQREEQEARRAKDLEQKQAQEEEMAKLFEGGGVPTSFEFKDCFDFDASCSLVGDFSGWKPLPMRRDSGGLDFELTVPLQPGKTYFYYFLVAGKVEIEKGKPTGLGNGVLCNRLNL